MKISASVNYGLRALVNIAQRDQNQASSPVLLKDIAKEENISEKYLEAIFASLKKADILDAVRGKNGGYLLSKNPSAITLFEIIEALDRNFKVIEYRHEQNILIKSFLKELNDKIINFIRDKKLSDLIFYEQSMYFI